MGIHICIYDETGKELNRKEWDYIRQGNDTEFNLSIVQSEERTFADQENYMLEGCFRFKYPRKVIDRIRLTGWQNTKRYEKLINLTSSKNWIYISY